MRGLCVRLALVVSVLLPVAESARALEPRVLQSGSRLRPVRAYIAETWQALTRSVKDLPLAAPDPKMHRDT
jgi:hypothetical protein